MKEKQKKNENISMLHYVLHSIWCGTYFFEKKKYFTASKGGAHIKCALCTRVFTARLVRFNKCDLLHKCTYRVTVPSPRTCMSRGHLLFFRA